jgi:hypothetical protein
MPGLIFPFGKPEMMVIGEAVTRLIPLFGFLERCVKIIDDLFYQFFQWEHLVNERSLEQD